MQVILVTGGLQASRGIRIGIGNYNGNDAALDSTEVLEDVAGAWRLTAPLPSAREGLRAASLENNIFVLGKNIFSSIGISMFNKHCLW